MATNTTKKSDVLVTSIDDELTAETVPEATNELAVSDHNDALTGDKVQLMLHSGATEAEKQAQFVGINGYGLLIPRDKWVVVPQEVVDQLDNCTMDLYTPLEGGGMTQSLVRRFATSVRMYKPAN